ncbi:hypothetical protein GCM10010499_19480 [Streptomyces thermoviolaceus subsp. apingens]|nr:hypothetical protein GCM10010499_19480 [Streptomyces thermoviolaceus subsp. apingens]
MCGQRLGKGKHCGCEHRGETVGCVRRGLRADLRMPGDGDRSDRLMNRCTTRPAGASDDETTGTTWPTPLCRGPTPGDGCDGGQEAFADGRRCVEDDVEGRPVEGGPADQPDTRLGGACDGHEQRARREELGRHAPAGGRGESRQKGKAT